MEGVCLKSSWVTPICPCPHCLRGRPPWCPVGYCTPTSSTYCRGPGTLPVSPEASLCTGLLSGVNTRFCKVLNVLKPRADAQKSLIRQSHVLGRRLPGLPAGLFPGAPDKAIKTLIFSASEAVTAMRYAEKLKGKHKLGHEDKETRFQSASAFGWEARVKWIIRNSINKDYGRQVIYPVII